MQLLFGFKVTVFHFTLSNVIIFNHIKYDSAWNKILHVGRVFHIQTEQLRKREWMESVRFWASIKAILGILWKSEHCKLWNRFYSIRFFHLLFIVSMHVQSNNYRLMKLSNECSSNFVKMFSHFEMKTLIHTMTVSK